MLALLTQTSVPETILLLVNSNFGSMNPKAYVVSIDPAVRLLGIFNFGGGEKE